MQNIRESLGFATFPQSSQTPCDDSPVGVKPSKGSRLYLEEGGGSLPGIQQEAVSSKGNTLVTGAGEKACLSPTNITPPGVTFQTSLMAFSPV